MGLMSDWTKKKTNKSIQTNMEGQKRGKAQKIVR